ncbi:hypothetical protein SKAU_G00074120 [Synaphobranchus kaupii]|uniref:Uncharacterized protein n=1 Tax=Synaphobranchus kaupii TaxID=118154 RepID=A0A9Q1JC10_SYNKA|nr:hypothetical protein SKAU_G00074120 [Synaphobranchus kaupii]
MRRFLRSDAQLNFIRKCAGSTGSAGVRAPARAQHNSDRQKHNQHPQLTARLTNDREIQREASASELPRCTAHKSGILMPPSRRRTRQAFDQRRESPPTCRAGAF